MKALTIDSKSPGSVVLRDVDEPAVPPGECKIAVQMAGICRTDLELAKGYMNFSGIPGHEFAGKVVQGPERLLGRRVVGEINAACGRCPACLSGMRRHCPDRTVLGIYKRAGAFAKFLTLPESNLLCIPDSVSNEDAVFVEPLAAALEIFEQIHVQPGARILVIGDGKLGLLIAQVCAYMGGRVTLFGRHEKKLALARRWNVEAVKNSERDAAVVPQFQRFPYVIECTGTPSALNTALAWTAPRGHLVLKSTYAPTDPPMPDWAKIVVDEITVVGSRCGPFAPALRLLSKGGIDVRCLIDHTKSLSQGVEAFALAATRGTLKVLVTVGA